MILRLIRIAGVLPPVLLSGMNANAQATVDQAYEACVAVIKANLKPETTADKIALADRKKNQSSGDEFYFVWSWGSITGAIRDRPDKLSGSMRPSAACIGSFAKRSLTDVTVNGADVISRPKKF